MFPKFECASEFPGGLLNHGLLVPTPSGSDLVGLTWDPRIHFLIKVPSDADAGDSASNFKNHCSTKNF